MKYRGKSKINNNFVFGYYSVDGNSHSIHTDHTTYPVYEDSISIYFGKKDKNGKGIYTNDKVKYKGKEYQVKYFEEYGAFGLYDNYCKKQLKGLYLSDYHTKQMEVI